jgi:acyl carrier protein
MTFDDILEAIRTTLAGPLANAHMDNFGPDAVLNDDLYLDSVIMLNLMLHLETDHGVEVPERSFDKEDFNTVGGLVRLLLGETEEPQEDDDFDPADITVHCVISCLSFAIRRHEGLDFRPFYFGTWDSAFAISDDQLLTYHSEDISHDDYFEWLNRLYGIGHTRWYDHTQSKAANVTRFEALLNEKSDDDLLMVMLDMFHLPERENKYNQNPFPHYVLIERSQTAGMVRLVDPDYRWEGDLPRADVLNAISQPTVAGGYMLHCGTAHAPAPAVFQAYFNDGFIADSNPLPDAIRTILAYHSDPQHPDRLANLGFALRELPVLLIRKYAYDHALAFFWRERGTPFAEFDAETDKVDTICDGYRDLHYLGARISHTGNCSLIPEFVVALDHLDAEERAVKSLLKTKFDDWSAWIAKGREDAPALETIA